MTTLARTTRVVMNADDFGRCPQVNEAVEQAHQKGVLTAASLMVQGSAAGEAVRIARRNPGLAIGLHLVMCDGRPTLDPARLSALVDDRGRFPATPLAMGLRLARRAAARRQLGAELDAQFQAFKATGLPLAHVDSHCNLHMHPAVFQRLTPLLETYRPGGLRLVRDRVLLALGHDRRRPGTRLAWAGAFAALRGWCQRRTPPAVTVPQRTFGLMQSGAMSETYVLGVLKRLRERVVELYFHPALGPRLERFGPNPGDLAALVSPRVRAAAMSERVTLCNYAQIREGGRDA